MSARDKLIRRLSEDSLGGIATLHDVTAAEQLVDAHRAEELREAAQRVSAAHTDARDTEHSEYLAGLAAAEELLIRLAAEARQEKATPVELTVYRASHDSIVMGHYTTAAAAREHCEADMRRDLPSVALDWIEDEEDGVAELVAAVGDDEHSTGFVVTPLTVASAYDPEADE